MGGKTWSVTEHECGHCSRCLTNGTVDEWMVKASEECELAQFVLACIHWIEKRILSGIEGSEVDFTYEWNNGIMIVYIESKESGISD